MSYRGARAGRSLRGNITPSSRSPVPTINQVVPSSPVSIVLKVDQPTGRQVQGFVADLLTRGNHPQGIKVRLRDGRVGRVQRMCNEEEARKGSEGLSGLGENGQVGSSRMPSNSAVGGAGVMNSVMSSGRGKVTYSDFRNDGYEAPEVAESGLMDYVVVKKNGKGKKGRGKQQPEVTSEANHREVEVKDEGAQPSTVATSSCPVCADFEGDEVAVAHHVNTHFK